ncbi:MAG: CRISPR-associated helicase Cas3' [Candidatus Thermoplasmatota archaeon]
MIVDILMAKSPTEKNYLLKNHLKETISRAIQLEKFIQENKPAITYNGFYDNQFFKNLIIACFLHDLGKINWRFQLNLFEEKEKEYDGESRRYKNEQLNNLYEFFKGVTDIDIKDHEIISLIYSLIFLDNEEWDKKIRTAILLHHHNQFYTNREINIRYIFDDYQELERYIKFLINKKEDIEKLLKNILEYLISEIGEHWGKKVLEELKDNIDFDRLKDLKNNIDNGYGLSTTIKLFEIPDEISDEKNESYDFFVFLGCLRRCDYSASGDVYIEEMSKLGESVYKDLNDKIKKKVKQKEIWQERILNEKDSDNLILIAPTGSGKTEFALLWAKNRGKKLIYTLPLRVALNDLYWRFCDKEEGYFDANFLRILHSTSFIEYLKEEKDGKELDIEEKQTTAKLFSSPLLLTTPDQVFLTSLKYYGFDKLVSVYPFSAIVIDEIQAYKPETAAVIIKTSEIIKKLCGNLFIITATFPPYFEKYFNEKNGFNVIDLRKIDDNEKNQIKNYYLKRHKIEVISNHLFEYKTVKNKNLKINLKINENSLNKIKGILEDNENKNILIIVNNVGKAIELYKNMKEKYNELNVNKENIYLLHSRILEKEKSRRISEIKKKLDEIKNKRENSKENGEVEPDERIILIATQIVEASVDVDFDILITEASSIDSQIQRWGRIYRSRREDYSTNTSNIFIFEGIDRGTSAIYDKRVIEKTTEILKNYQNKTLNYENEIKIIEEVFDSKTDDKPLKQIFVDEINKNLEWLKYYSAEKRSEAQRIFRNIAGVQVAVPAFMFKSSDNTEKKFGEIVMDKNNWKKSWNEIVEIIRKEVGENSVDKWKLMKILYDYSFNLPIFALERKIIEENNFKGFFILNFQLQEKEKTLEEINEYGVNKIEEVIDIDLKEIEQNENIF